MTLTKLDLSAIKQVVREETQPQFKKIDSQLQKLDEKIDKVDRKLSKKIDKVSDFLDKDISLFRKKVAYHLNLPISEFT